MLGSLLLEDRLGVPLSGSKSSMSLTPLHKEVCGSINVNLLLQVLVWGFGLGDTVDHSFHASLEVKVLGVGVETSRS